MQNNNDKSIEEKVKLYEQLAGNAKEAGEEIQELLKITEREEEWRGRDFDS